MRLIVLMPALFIAAMQASTLSSQSSTVIEPGDSLHVLARSVKPASWTGTFVAVSADHLILSAVNPASAPLTIPLSQITAMDLYRRSGVRRTGQGAIVGIATGAAVLGAIGYFATDSENPERASGLLLVIPGGVLGGLIGGLIGSSSKKPGWQRIAVPASSNSVKVPVRPGIPGLRSMQR